jgi:hypothetical protein
MKFEADMVMKGLYKSFQPKFDAEVPTKEKMALDLMDDPERNSMTL